MVSLLVAESLDELRQVSFYLPYTIYPISGYLNSATKLAISKNEISSSNRFTDRDIA